MMLRYFKLIRSLGLGNFLWKLFLFAKKKLGLETLFQRYYDYHTNKFFQQAEGYFQVPRCFEAKAIESLLLTGSGLKGKLARSVQEINEKRYAFFSQRVLSIASIDYSYDYSENIKWPENKHASRYFQFDENLGDIKEVWELNRLQYLNPLIPGYLSNQSVAEKERIRNTFFEHFQSWLDQNPHDKSVAWACSQEISIRCIQVMMHFSFLEMERQVKINHLNMLLLSAKHVYKQINYARAQRNNHAITESCFLIMFSFFFPGLKESQRFLSRGEKVLEECLADQFFEDGAYIQNSHTYHRFALQSLLLISLFDTNERLKSSIRVVFEKSLYFLNSHISNDTGEFPNYGPNDGAMLYNFGGCDYRDMRPIVNLLSLSLNQGYLYDDPKTLIDASIFGLYGKENKKLQPNQFVKEEYKQSGYFIRSSGDFKLYFRCGHYKNHNSSQCDMLHLDVWHRGKNIFVDGGTKAYYSRRQPEEFIDYLSTAVHNTVKIGNIEQAEKGPRFTWLTKAHGTLLEAQPNELEGCHDGFKGRVGKDTVHIRNININKSGFVVTDKCAGLKGENVKLFWNLGMCEVEEVGEGEFFIDQLLKLTFSSENNLKISVLAKGKSYYYSNSVATPTICVEVLNTEGSEVIVKTQVEETIKT